jgi:hypothetical protein
MIHSSRSVEIQIENGLNRLAQLFGGCARSSGTMVKSEIQTLDAAL